MDLETYLEKTGETQEGFAKRSDVSHVLVRSIVRKRRTPLLAKAIKVEKATEGSVNALEILAEIEGYKPVDPKWAEWWANRPSATSARK